jgi:UDP-N-acetylglucosamine 2-epimerase
VLQHPVTTEEYAERQVQQTLVAVASAGLPAFWFCPNVDAGGEQMRRQIDAFRKRHSSRLNLLTHMAGPDFLKLLLNARCLVGNSSVGIRECSFLGVPAVNIGTRQRDRVRGRNVIDVGCEWHEIADGIKRQMAVGRYASETLYGDGRAGSKIAEALAELYRLRRDRSDIALHRHCNKEVDQWNRVAMGGR